MMIELFPWGKEWGTVAVYTEKLQGYWECRDGSEGGMLNFELLPDGRLELVDYDGAFALPNPVVATLRAAGFVLDETFD